MPRLSESMQDGLIVAWLRAPGERVAQGEELVEIETDKATVTCEAEADGPLEIRTRAGETAAVGAPIARIGDTAAAAPAAAAARPKASPLARKLARERGVDLAPLRGSGPGGRIVRADIETAAGGGTAVTSAASAMSCDDALTATTPATDGRRPAAAPATVAIPTSAQRAMAARMVEAKRTIPEFTVSAEFDMDGCAELRERLPPLTEPAPTYNDLVVKAVALALREHPRLNASYRDGEFHLYQQVNVAIAVAARDALLVPVVRDADRRNLADLADATRALAERARAGTISPAELDGATFTVSNLGGYGVREFTAVINPPQAAILAVGAVEQRPTVRDGVVVPGRALAATLTCDHRIVDGAAAAAFLRRVGDLLAEPLALLLDPAAREETR